MRKALTVIKNILVWMLLIAAVGMMLFTIASAVFFDRSERDLFGYKAFTVLTDSMSSTDGDAAHGHFNAGDLVLVKEVDPATLKEGDIISFRSTDPKNYGETVTHMIRSLTVDAAGEPGFITYGTATGIDDTAVVTYPFVLGKYQTSFPKVGTFFEFLKTTPGYIICIFIPFLLLILSQGFSAIRLFKQYKAEQLAEIEAQREKDRAELEEQRRRLEEEQQKSNEMMREIMELKKAMMAANADKSDAAPSTETDK